MQAHVIENNLVVNTIEVDSLDYLPNLVEATEGGLGWSYIDGIFSPPEDKRTNEQKAEDIRQQRNLKLEETDWMATSDYVMSDAWKIYRQALRDVPNQDGFPQNVIWPTKPE